MRTTISIDEHPLAEAKARAAASGRTLNAVVEDALRESFARRAGAARPSPSALPIFRGSRQAPGVDLDLAALAIESGSELVTTDRDFSRFAGLRWRHPLAEA